MITSVKIKLGNVLVILTFLLIHDGRSQAPRQVTILQILLDGCPNVETSETLPNHLEWLHVLAEVDVGRRLERIFMGKYGAFITVQRTCPIMVAMDAGRCSTVR